ncbi:MAG: endonuclease/exonuclease/phosphatase family protein [Pirellulales bacterium]
MTVLRAACWVASATLLAFVFACYWWRFDSSAFVTLFPPWCWALGGFGLAWLGHAKRHRWRSGVLLALWLAFLLLAADSPASIWRALWPAAEQATAIRVVSLNCAGNSSAARDVERLEPDIILFQESPTAQTLTELAASLYGSDTNLVRGYDPTIVARGKVTAVPVPPQYYQNFVHARVELDGRVINVISLRLFPCPVNLEFWSRDCWRYYQTNRENRRRQLATIAEYAKTLPPEEPLIIGGDFNCPPRDAALESLKPWLTDAFTVAGRGWGATIIEFSGLPLIRIDQIWTNSQLHAVDVFAERIYGSDHHATVADFQFTARQY